MQKIYLLPYTCDIDKSVIFPHDVLGVVINANAVIKRGTTIYQSVTIGGNGKRELDGKILEALIIGENVIIGVGATILGPVIIENGVKIGQEQ